ncbi:MAG: InlB B-repeat-containing protein [Candidatus Methanoplasma sp.]|jgi:hypothetical protein|nr:InlB B-repeat-containing protein [Candidatus Methanoplasma sp.]
MKKTLILLLVVVVVAVVAVAAVVLLSGNGGEDEKEPETPVIETYTVTYCANGGSGVTESQTVTVGSSAALRDNAFIYTGRYFEGWATNPEGTGKIYSPGESYTPTSDIKFCVKWSTQKTVAISYYSNNGTDKVIKDYRIQSSISLIELKGSTAFEWSGHKLSSWNTQADGKGVARSPGDLYIVSSDVSFYAQWDQSILKYVANDGTSKSSEFFATNGNILSASASTFTWEGHTFDSWNTKADGSGTEYKAGSSLIKIESSDVTLYAQWKT